MNHSIGPIGIVLALSLVGCGSAEPTGDAVDVADCYPMAVGDYWEYQEVYADGSDTEFYRREVTDETTMVFDYDVGERQVFVHHITFPGYDKYRYYYVEDDGEEISRVYQERFNGDGDLTTERTFAPPLSRFQRSASEGGSWSDSCTRHDIDYLPVAGEESLAVEYTFEIVSISEQVTVPAGTFDCVLLTRTDSFGEAKSYYYAPGVGKVKEVSAGGDTGDKSEELTEYYVGAP